jgi:hypothetical protein
MLNVFRIASLASVKQCQRLSFSEPIPPGGKELTFQDELICEKGDEHLGLHPGATTCRIFLGEVPCLKEAFESLESEFDLPPTTIEIQNLACRDHITREAGQHTHVGGELKSPLSNVTAFSFSFVPRLPLRSPDSGGRFVHSAQAEREALAFVLKLHGFLERLTWLA